VSQNPTLSYHYQLLTSNKSLSSTCLNGGLFPHLRASRQLISWLLEEPNRPTSSSDKYILGLVLEIYAYLVLVNVIGPLDSVKSRELPLDDPFVRDLESLKQYPTFGIAFVGFHGLFQLIPWIAEFATVRIEEGAKPSAASEAAFGKLKDEIEDWKREKTQWSRPEDDADLDCLAVVYKHALLLFVRIILLAPQPCRLVR
jgi:hypothetical protein